MKKSAANKAKLAAVAAAVAVAVGAWHASLRRPAGPAEGVALAVPQPDEKQTHPAAERRASPEPPVTEPTLRLATFNIHGGRGEDDRVDLQRTAEAIRRFHIVGLNEVRGHRLATPNNQAAEVGCLLGRPWLHGPAEYRWYCQSFGNGLLTALPARRWQRIALTHRLDRSYRNALLVAVDTGPRPLNLLITHLTQRVPEERASQFRMVAGLFLSLDEPAVLLGDLNYRADDRLMADLLARPGVVEPVSATGAADVPDRVDWVLLRGLECVAAGVEATSASDHPVVWCEVVVPCPGRE
jgi:endonuclease/exonuclease/phosphatase family metal-dependent hydrolase